MARWRPLLLAFAALFAAPHAARAQDESTSPRIDAGRSGFSGGGVLGRPPLRERWRMPFVDAAAPVVADGRVITLSRETDAGPYLLQARAVTDGHRLWSRTTDGTGTDLAYASGTVVVASTDGLVMAIDAGTGATRWSRDVDGRAREAASLTVTDGLVYAGPNWGAGELLALDLRDGSVRWSHRVDYVLETLVAGGQLFGSSGCELEALGAVLGEDRFERPVPCRSGYETGVAANGGVVVSAGGGVVDAADGHVIDRVPSAYAGGPQPALAGDTVVAEASNTLVGRSLSRQVDAWSIPVASAPDSPLVVDGVVYRGSFDGTLSAYDLATGATVWSDRVASGSVGYPSMVAGQGLLLVPAGDELLAIGSATPSPAAGLRITAGPSGPVRSDAASFTIAGATTGLTRTCALDAGLATPCTTSVSYTGLSEGPHTVTVRATDAGGAVRGLVSRAWSVDRAAPVASLTDSAPPRSRDQYHDIQATTPEGAPVECRVDDGSWFACRERVSLRDLADGPHVIEARGSDGQGNVQSPPTRREVVVDRTGPTVDVRRAPPFVTQSSDARIEWTVGADTLRTRCVVDGDYRQPCSSPIELHDLREGYHSVAIVPMDDLGNETYRYVQWTVDRTAPTWRLRLAPPTRTNEERVTVGVDGEYGATYECRVDDDSWAGCPADRTWLTRPLDEGEHVIRIRATDQAGNVQEDPPLVRFVIDRTAPELRVTERPPSRSTSRSVRARFSSEDGASFTCRLNGVTGPCESPWTSEDLPDGEHTLRITATDRAGNTTSDATTFTVAADGGTSGAGTGGGAAGSTGGGSAGGGSAGGGSTGGGSTTGGSAGGGSSGSGTAGGARGDGAVAGTESTTPTGPAPSGLPAAPDGAVVVFTTPSRTLARTSRTLATWLAARPARRLSRVGVLALPYAGSPGSLEARLTVGGRTAMTGRQRVAASTVTWLALRRTRAGARLLRGARSARLVLTRRGPDGRVERVVRTVRLR